jgi:predicted nucleic acid-binding Zn ribbon protein
MDSPFYDKSPKSSSRKSTSSSLKEVIESLLKVYKLQGKFDETYVSANWEQIMGKPIAARTQKVYVSNQKLFLQIDSAPLKKELMMAKQKMIELINKSADNEVIKEVVFL